MNICIGFHGQVRNFKQNGNNLKSQIIDDNDKNNYIVLFSTWENEPIQDFLDIFPIAYVKQYAIEDNTKMFWDSNISMDITNSYKKLIDFWRYQKSLENLYLLIEEYEQKNNIKFDLILRIRPDIKLNMNLCEYYFYPQKGHIYVPSQPNYDIFGIGAYPDLLALGGNEEMKDILNGIYVVKFCTIIINGDKIIHPETLAYSIVKYYNYECFCLNDLCAEKL